MSRPKTPSELHPDYPRDLMVHSSHLTYRDPVLGRWTHHVPSVSSVPDATERVIAFYAAHPEFQDEPSYEFRCEMCGDEIDPDRCYCRECQDHSGSWVLVDKDGEEV